jgi:DNA repair protein RadC
MADPDPLFGLLPPTLADPAAASDLFAPLAGEETEVAAFVYLGEGQRLLGIRHARSASRDTLDLPIREIVGDALAYGALGVVMAHNHPGGDPTPSPADREVTRRLALALEPLGVRLIDHLVIAEGGVVSFRRLGLL